MKLKWREKLLTLIPTFTSKMMLITRAGEEIKTIEDLKGKKIGFPFGATVDLTCRMLLKQNNIDPNKDVQLVNLEVGDVPAVFTSKNVDAALIWEPGFSRLKAVDNANVLGLDTDTEVFKQFGTMTGPDVLVIGKKWVDQDPERAKKFMAAYFASVQWVKEHTDEAVNLVAGTYIQQDSGQITENMAKFIWHDLAAQKQVMSDAGIFGQARYIIDLLHDDMNVIPNKPDFMQWVNLEVLGY